MSYTKTNWVNDTEPAINATNLNKIEDGIETNADAIGNLSDLTTTADTDLVSAINELDSLKATKDVATTALNGLMSSVDKASLNSIFGIPTDTVTNLDNVYEGSFKFADNTTNAPTSVGGKVLCFKLTNDNYRFQLVMTNYNAILYTRYRYYYSGQWYWSSWYPIETTDNYSTTETLTNKRWTNGKSVYRIVQNFTVSSGWQKIIDMTTYNADTIIKKDIIMRGSGNTVPFYFVGSGSTASYGFIYENYKNSLWFASSGLEGYSYTLVVEYTKQS